jgi:DNA-directed RNA polymerase III subunit RPC1
MKETVNDDHPRYIRAIEFGILSPQEIVKQAEVQIATRDLYDLEQGRIPKKHGAIDRRMVSI